MTDKNKFRILMFLTTILTALILFYNVAQEYFMPDIEAYITRRVYYEKVISKKGLSLHKGMYWREKE